MKRSLIELSVFFSVACCVWCSVILPLAGRSREVNQNVEHDRFIALWVVLSVVFGVPIVVGCFVLAVRACFGKFFSAA